MKYLKFIFLVICVNYVTGQNVLQAIREPNNYFVSRSITNNKKRNDPSKPWRLPLDIKPLRYDVTLSPIIDENVPDLGEQWTAPGNVIISFSVLNPTSKIVIHSAKDLVIPGTTSVKQGGIEIPFFNETFDEETQFHIINFDQTLSIGASYSLEMKFVAPIIEHELNGLYRSGYTDPATNQTKFIAVTQMEALHARQVFPCFDETSFKAIFRFTIGRKSSNVALANAISLGTEPMNGVNGWVWEKFDDTVQMSTYLLAIVVSQFEYVQSVGNILPNLDIRTYAPKHYIERGGGVYPCDVAERLMKNYTDLFGQTYPMSKLDLAAVPDFWFGAMENYGLNIYRELLLLYFPGETTENQRMTITDVIAHELAHQWFGNLVSPAFWTHIWLNEGVSSYLEYVGLNLAAPEFKAWDSFIPEKLQAALAHDAKIEGNHPLKIDEDEWITKWAMDWFDLITYNKGGCITRMMEGFLTESILHEGFRVYQQEMKFQAAEQDDFFRAISSQVSENQLPPGKNLTEVMNTWTLQSGFPYLLVTEEPTNPNVIQITQTKFADESSTSQWIVPLSIASAGNPDFDPRPEYWLTSKTLTISESSDSWILLNAGTTGYYRVLYTPKLETLIANQLANDHLVIHHHARGQLINDYFNFALDRTQSNMINRTLTFTKYMGIKSETEFVVWNSLLVQMTKFLNYGSATMRDSMKAYLLPRLQLAINATGGVDVIDKTSRGSDVIRHTQLLDWACTLDDPDCLSYSLRLVQQWEITNITNNPVPLDLQPVVYCAAARNLIEYQRMTARYVLSQGTIQNSKLLRSLSCTQEFAMIDSMLNNIFHSTSFLEKSHALTFMTGLASNHVARPHLLQFIKTETQQLVDYFGDSSSIVSVVSALSNFYGSIEELNELELFINDNDDILPDMSSYLNRIRSNIEINAEFGIPIQQFFQSNL